MTEKTPNENDLLSPAGLNEALLPDYLIEGLEAAQNGNLPVEDLRKLQERINNLQGDYSKITEFLRLAGGAVGRAKTKASIKETKDELAKQFNIDAQDLEVVGENGFGGGPDIDNGPVVVYDKKRGEYAMIEKNHKMVGGVWFAEEPNPLAMHQVLQAIDGCYYLVNRMPHYTAEKIKEIKVVPLSNRSFFVIELENGKKYFYRRNDGFMFELPECDSISQIQGNYLATKKDGKFELFYMNLTEELEYLGNYEAVFLCECGNLQQVLVKHRDYFGFLIEDEFRSYSKQAVIFEGRRNREKNAPTKLEDLPKSEKEAIRMQMKKAGVEEAFFGQD